MKYLSRFFFALVFLFSFSTSAWLNGQTIVEVGSSLSDTPQDEQFEFVGNTTFSGGTGFLSGLSVTGSAVGDFTFDVTIAPVNVAGTGELNFDANFISEGNSSTTNNQFNNGDVFSITVSNVVTTAPVAVGESVVFDGFTNIGTADTGTGEGIEINGVSYLRGTSTNGDNDVRFGVAFPGGIVAGPTLIVESVGTTALRGVALRFRSSVPQVLEPLDPIDGSNWTVDTTEQWSEAIDSQSSSFGVSNGFATAITNGSVFQSRVQSFTGQQNFQNMVIRQNKQWTANKWGPPSEVNPDLYTDDDVGPAIGGNGDRGAPVFLLIQDGDYWVFHHSISGRNYHAFHSTDMVNWLDMGVIGSGFFWVTTAEYHDGRIFIYTDRPNDHDPTLLTFDYVAGSGEVFAANGNPITGTNPSTDNGSQIAVEDHGVVLEKPYVTVDGETFALAGGSDNCVFLDPVDGQFHMIYENWSRQNAQRFSFDTNIASHSVSPDGINGFVFDEAVRPIDMQGNLITQAEATDPASFTQGNGRVETVELAGVLYHVGDHPNIRQLFRLTDELHGWGDYTMIKVGETYYLFADDDNENGIGLGYWYSNSLSEGFTYGGRLREGLHPDPGVGFGEGHFVMMVQGSDGGLFGNDLLSFGPWVQGVEAQAGVDVDGDGEIDQWTDWQVVTESYYQIEGFSKAFGIEEAVLDMSSLPAGYGVAFQLRSASGGVVFDNVDISSEAVSVLGDFDADGDVDGDDVDFYIGNLDQPAVGQFAQLDLNGDGEVTLADHDFHVTTLVMTSNGVTGALLGDINLDGVVDVLTDAFALIANLGGSSVSRSQGDLNADGIVTVLGDAFLLISQLGQSNT